MIFLDAAATTPVRREVLEAMWPQLTADFGNPSSHHELGESAKRALEGARARVAAVLECRASDVVFTAGGTESDNLAIKGLALAAPRGRHIITSAIEHEAVSESVDYLVRLHGFEVTVLAVDAEGLVDLGQLSDALRPDTTLCTIMYANNEVGVVEPIAEISRLCAEFSVPFHTDAVQAAGWLPLSIAALGVDALSLSGHKLGAPKGSGVLMVRGRRAIEPVIHGGGQERGRRSGTENVAGAVGFAVALGLAERDRLAKAATITVLRDNFVADVRARVAEAIVTGPQIAPSVSAGAGIVANVGVGAALRLPANASFCFPGTSGESLLLELGRVGIVCSAGSACAVGSDEASPVLLAMGIDPAVAHTAVRFSLSADTSAEELATVAAAIQTAYGAVRSLAG
ncbi:MAG: cysteine desulfurase family protein [Rhodoglobus sp.]